MTWLPEKKIEEMLSWNLLFGCGRAPALIKYKRKNYLAPHDVSLAEACAKHIRRDLGFEFDGEVCLLTNLQYGGICFNPVSFYYCYSQEGELQAIVAEINNTPWNERHCYCIDMRFQKRREFDKKFHISPFMPMDINYRWSFNKPQKKLQVHMQNLSAGELIFDATMKLQSRPFTRLRLFSFALLYPMIPLKVMLGIYWHALRLYLKKIPFYSHPKTGEQS